jgi:hypothetical protein
VKRTAVALLCASTASGLAACESNQERSAAIGRKGKHEIAASTAFKLGAANADVSVLSTTLIDGVGGAQAVAVQLRDTGAAQADVPVLLQARRGAGAPLYSNATAGLQPSLQQIALLTPGQPVWWVDDQVLGAPSQASLSVRVGTGRPAAKVPSVTASATALASQGAGTYLTGTLTNRSGVAQPNLPVFAVGERGGKVVAAGRAIVPRLPASATPVPAAFKVFFVGNPAGAQISVTVAPTAGA